MTREEKNTYQREWRARKKLDPEWVHRRAEYFRAYNKKYQDRRNLIPEVVRKRAEYNCVYHKQRNEKKKEIPDFVNSIKSKTPCKDCGNVFPPECMDFDHLRDKKYSIAMMVAQRFPLEEVISEIKKCEIVCSNCHRIRTHERRCNSK